MVQILLGGQNLGVVAHLPHLALDGFNFPPLEAFLQGGAGCRRGKREETEHRMPVALNPAFSATTGIIAGYEDYEELMIWI